MHAYKRPACKILAYEILACEIHACEIPAWEMPAWEMHVWEVPTCEMHAWKRYRPCKRCTPVRDARLGDIRLGQLVRFDSFVQETGADELQISILQAFNNKVLAELRTDGVPSVKGLRILDTKKALKYC